MTAMDDDDVVAAGLVFGLLDADERRNAQDRLGADPAFAERHGWWQAHAATLLTAEDAAPRPSLWSEIAARLPANDTGAGPSAPAVAVRRWRSAALAASVIAVVLGGVSFRQIERTTVRVPVAQAPTAPIVAVLTGAKGVVTVSFDRVSGHLTSAVNGIAPNDRALELWVIPADKVPRSLGLLSTSAPQWRTVPNAVSPLLEAGSTVAVSLEPEGGSPAGVPTGPVILSGTLTRT